MLNITSGDMCWGYRNYLAHLVPRLAAHPKVEALLVGVPQSVDPSKWAVRVSCLQWLPLRCSLSSRGREISTRGKKQVERFAPDVLFIPTARYWSLDGIPVVNMVRNMMPVTPSYSKHWLDRIKTWARFTQMCSAVEKSSRVIAVSCFVRNYLIDDLGISSDKVDVVYHGTELSHDEPCLKPSGIPDNWPGSFVFTAGSIYPYRGLEDIILSCDRLTKSGARPFIAIAGSVGGGMRRYYNYLKQLIHEKNLDMQIRFVGTLTQSEMAWCYTNCSAFVMTSRIEACPNIALEAMANGCLCISTRNAPLPEIFAGAAQYYSAGEPGELAECISSVLDLPYQQQQEMKNQAVARASEFTWEACCNRTVGELQKAIQTR